MLVDTLRDATVIPTAAVQRGKPGTFVYVVKADNTVTVRPLKLGPTQGEVVAVACGIKPGENVVSTARTSCAKARAVEIADRLHVPTRPALRKGDGGRRTRGPDGDGTAPKSE